MAKLTEETIKRNIEKMQSSGPEPVPMSARVAAELVRRGAAVKCPESAGRGLAYVRAA
jgi:hypothetical protein